jgi:hypothetical protein
MPRNGSGTYTRPQSDYVSGTTILATSVNSDLNDMAQALTASIARDGQTIPTANLPMGNFRHTGVADGTARTDYAALGQTQNGAFLWGGTAGGTANAITISLNPPLAAYGGGQEFRFISSAANTGAVTLNINSLGAVALNKGNGTVALIAGDLPASAIVTVIYDGTRFRLINAQSGLGATLAASADSAAARSTIGAPAIPQNTAGVGYWVAQNFAIGAAAVLPAGGRWSYFLLRLNSGVISDFSAGEAAAGTTVGTAAAGQNWIGFVWRVV